MQEKVDDRYNEKKDTDKDRDKEGNGKDTNRDNNSKKPLDERAIKEEEKMLREFDFYHGFLPREDLPYLLRGEGEFLIRMSEVVDSTDSARMHREIILSVYVGSAINECSMVPGVNQEHMTKIKNVIVRRLGSRYYVETAKMFDVIKELVDYYQTNWGKINKVKFLLRRPILLQPWEFSHSDVILGDVLGEGAYGIVRAATLKTKKASYDVAVKQAKGNGEMSKAKIKEMMKEARLMRNFRHKNIVFIYGVAVLEQPLYMILELVSGGSLIDYLKKRSPSAAKDSSGPKENSGSVPNTPKEPIGLKEKLNMVLGAASGVGYLHRHNCIHRDLAARNCLYTDDKIVKISDFGLSRSGSMYVLKSMMKLPIRWLAPESLSTFSFSLKTDVFTFGVLIYEIFADGGEPWEGQTNADVKKLVIEGQSLTLPPSCPEKLRVFVKERLLNKDPNKRVSMIDVVRFLENVQTETSIKEEADVGEDETDQANTDGENSKTRKPEDEAKGSARRKSKTFFDQIPLPRFRGKK